MSDNYDDGPRLSLLHGSLTDRNGSTAPGASTPADTSISFHTLGAGQPALTARSASRALPPAITQADELTAATCAPQPAPATGPEAPEVSTGVVPRRTVAGQAATGPQNPVDVAEEILRSAALKVGAGTPSPNAQPGQDAVEGPHTVEPVAAAVAPSAETWKSVRGRLLVLLVLGDVLTVVGSTWVIVEAVSAAKGHDMLVRTTTLAAALGVLGWTAAVAFMGGYAVRSPGFRGGAVREALSASAVLLGILASLRAVWDVGLPAAAILLVPLVALVLGVCGRVVVRRVIRRARGQGRWLTRALVVSTNSRPEALVARLDQRTGHGMSIVGICTDHARPAFSSVPVLGGVEDTCEVAGRLAVDMVVIDCDAMAPDELRQLLWRLEEDELAAVIAPPMGEIDPSRISIMPTMDSTLMGVRLGGRLSGWMVKGAFDRVVGSLLLFLLSPVLLGAAAAVAVSSPGPVFFRQVRVGRDGKHFSMWKFRSMYTDAEERRAALAAESDGAGLLFKMKDDPRVTPVGRLLRRFSVDELPQLFNVVTGQMALVGPRPALPQEVAEYDWSVSQRLKVRPGMTGLWQVSGRSNLSWEESVRLDLRYADNWSIRMDLAILWATVGAVFGGEGAY